MRRREEKNKMLSKYMDRIKEEHSTHELFLGGDYLCLCNKSAVKCVPCTVPHFIVHKDADIISPETTSMNCLSLCYTF